MNNTLEILLQEEMEQNGRTEETQSRILSLNKELASQKEKLDRANKQVGHVRTGRSRSEWRVFEQMHCATSKSGTVMQSPVQTPIPM